MNLSSYSRKFIATCALLSLSGCSTSLMTNPTSTSRNVASQYAEISEEFEGKDFFKEVEGKSFASLFGQHDVATFFKWSLENPIPLFERLRKEQPIYESRRS